MSRTRTLASRTSAPLLAALLAGAVLSPSTPAHLVDLDAHRQNRAALSLVLADQGNRALQSIRAESRASIRSWTLPELPAPALAGEVLLIASDEP